jgi:hypothetical protein
MSKPSLAHDGIEWGKHKLNELDSMLASVEGLAVTLTANARRGADAAAARIAAARNALKTKFDAARAQAPDVKAVADQTYVGLQTEYANAEAAFQEFLTAAAGQADVVAKALAARLDAQRKLWQTTVDSRKKAVSDAVDQARAEVEASIRRLDAETEKRIGLEAKDAAAKLGKVSAAGEESWKAIKSGVDEVRSVFDRALKKISDAVDKAGQA